MFLCIIEVIYFFFCIFADKIKMLVMNHDCLLSIIVPVYNVEKYIRACIESIFRQNLDENVFEVIIVNDGTTDHSMEVIQDIIREHSNISVITQRNLSLSVARNNGIEKAKGEYVLMPDSDDLLIDNSLLPLLKIAVVSKVDLLVADFLEMTDKDIDQITTISQLQMNIKEKTGRELFLEDLNPHQCYVWRTLYRRDFIINNDLKFIPGIRYQDVPFTHECYLKADKCLRVNWLLNIYRRGHESATFSFDKKKAKDLCISIASTWKLREIEGLPDYVRKKLNNNIFVSFTLLIYLMLYGIKNVKDRREIFAFLRSEVPDLKFSDGLKQKVTFWLFNLSPTFYFFIRQLLKWCTPKPNLGLGV